MQYELKLKEENIYCRLKSGMKENNLVLTGSCAETISHYKKRKKNKKLHNLVAK